MMRSATWRIGAAVFVAALAAVAVPVVAEATEPDVAPQATEAGPCSNLQGRITSVTAVGPGKVAVEGLAQPGAADDPACDTGAHLYAYSGRGNMEFWYKDMVLGQSEVRPTGGAFAGNVTMVMGSWAVCLEDAQRRPLDCVNVLHPGAKNEAGVWRPAPPIVRGWINVHLGQARPDGGGHEHLPECGHCI